MFFGWRVVAGSFVSMLLVVGFFTYSATLLVTPVRLEFDASLEQVMYGFTLGTFFGLFLSPLCGVLVDRYSVRYLMTCGCLVTSLGFWGMANASSIGIFSLCFAATMSLGNSLAGSMPATAAVSRWFVSSRGRALGIATIGTSVGGVAVPALLTWWLSNGDWRAALENLALLTALLVTPWVWLNIRGRPEDIGLQAEGSTAMTAATQASAAAAGDESMDMKAIVREPAFWIIGLSVGLLVAVFSSIITNLSPYATGLGVSEVRASSLIVTLAIVGLFGKLLFGMAADKFSLRAGMYAAQGLVAIALIILATQPPYWLMLLGAACMGLATGGLLPVWNAMVAQVFGVNSYGRALGLMFPIVTLLLMPAYTLVGRLYDHHGDYVLCLQLYVGVVMVSALLLTRLKIDTQPPLAVALPG